MRVIAVLGGLVVLIVGLFVVAGPERPGHTAADAAPVTEPTTSTSRYGEQLASGEALPTTPTPEDTPTVETDGTGSTAASEPTEPTASAPATATESTVGEDTTLIDDSIETVHHDHSHSEEESEDEFPDLAEGEFPVSSNLPEGTDYPLRAMVDLAVALLDAEVTGAGRENFPHLADQVSVCCEGLEIDGAAVLFGATTADPATIIIDWHADAAGEEVRTIRGSTQTRWFWQDDTWVGEYELLLEGSGS